MCSNLHDALVMNEPKHRIVVYLCADRAKMFGILARHKIIVHHIMTDNIAIIITVTAWCLVHSFIFYRYRRYTGLCAHAQIISFVGKSI